MSQEQTEQKLTLESVRKAIPEHLFVKNEARFMISVLYSVSLTIGTALLAYKFVPINIYTIPFWIVYAFVTGTIWIGLWVLGHECGHGAFSDSKLANDILGYILHTTFLVPYFSWQHSHYVHHSRTNHLTEGETHVPSTNVTKNGIFNLKLRDIIGTDSWAIFQMFNVFVIGWPAYLFFGLTGGPKRGFTSHFIVPNELFPTKKLFHVGLSNLGLIIMLYLLYLWAQKTSFADVMAVYIGPYLVGNAWLTGYTWLQHTDENVPHYDEDTWDWLSGALCSIDRNYPEFINALHFDIGSTHVIHHLFSGLPHYNAREATLYIKKALGNVYRCDKRPIWKTLWSVASLGVVEKKEKGSWFYIKKYPYYDKVF